MKRTVLCLFWEPAIIGKMRIIFRWSGYNTYTLAVLIGLLQERMVPGKFVIDTADTAEAAIRKSRADSDITVLAYSFCTPQFNNVKKEIKLIRKTLGAKVIIICGGPHTSALPENVLKAGADFSFVGETEESLPHFLNSLYETGGKYKERIIYPLPLKDFDSYPPFAYKIGFLTPVEIRRGCKTGCTFCQTPRMFGCIRERSIEYVKKTANHMKRAGREIIYFLIPDALSYGSENNNVDLSGLESLLKEVRSTGVKINLGNFPSEVSPRKLVRFPEAASILKKYVRNTKILIGGQSASENVLRIMKRDHNVEDITDSVKILKGNGFTPIVDVLLGIPGETRQDRLDTLKFMGSLAEKHKARLNLHYFIPLPGTPLADTRPEPLEDEIKEKMLSMIRCGHARGNFLEQLGNFTP